MDSPSQYRYMFVPVRQYSKLSPNIPVKENIQVIRLHAAERIADILAPHESKIYEYQRYDNQQPIVASSTIQCDASFPQDPHDHIICYLEHSYHKDHPDIINRLLGSMAYVGFKVQRKISKEELIPTPDEALAYINKKLIEQLKKDDLLDQWIDLKENFYSPQYFSEAVDFFMKEGKKVAKSIEMTLLHKN